MLFPLLISRANFQRSSKEIKSSLSNYDRCGFVGSQTFRRRRCAAICLNLTTQHLGSNCARAQSERDGIGEQRVGPFDVGVRCIISVLSDV